MSFPKEYYIRAENEIQLRSIKNQMIQADRIQEVTGKVPLIASCIILYPKQEKEYPRLF